MELRVTEVKIIPMSDGGRVKAYASITLGGALAIRDIRLIQSSEKMIIAMPSKKLKEGGFMDLAFPVTREARQAIESAIIEEYKRAVGEDAV